MREGGLALRSADVDFARGLITLRGETTKSKRRRFVPIVTARLRASLNGCDSTRTVRRSRTMLSCSVMKWAIRLGSFRAAWVTAVLKAQGIKPDGSRTAGRR